jgi:hypothetical protein
MSRTVTMRACYGRSYPLSKPGRRSSVSSAFGLKPPDLRPPLFALLTARFGGLVSAAMTAHPDPHRQTHPTGWPTVAVIISDDVGP